MSKEAIAGLSPAPFWNYFYEISQIPRGSGNEEALRQYLIRFAEEQGLSWKTDSIGNVCINKPASEGREKAPGVILQGHMDMVCEKNQGTDHDFEKDPIRLVRDGDWIHADKTTLGADNGIAVAAGLAILADKELEHGPLELLLTVDEESALTGAMALDPAIIEGRILLNLDSEEEGVLTIGCAGGKNTEGYLPVQRETAPQGMKPLAFSVKGLKGGHSGADIHKELGNAILLGNRILWNLFRRNLIRLASLEGGGLHNAIPREFFAVVLVASEHEKEVRSYLAEMDRTFREELKERDPGVHVAIQDAPYPDHIYTEESARSLLHMIYAMPHGVFGWSPVIHGLVETSTNLANVRLEGDELYVLSSQRSSVPSLRDDIADKVRAALEGSGARTCFKSLYPAWQPDPDSEVLAVARRVHKEMYGDDPQVGAIHAGLECGVIGEKAGNLDMLSFGPDLEAVHTPEERMSIPSAGRFYDYLIELLRVL